MAGSHPPASNALPLTEATPIAQLHPEIPDAASRVVHGVVTITWPYSALTNSIAFILAELDFRLRYDHGQLRIEFRGAAARALSEAGLGGGDELRFSLDGAVWEKPQAQMGLPGSSLQWQLCFSNRLLMEIHKVDSQAPQKIYIDGPPEPDPPSVLQQITSAESASTIQPAHTSDEHILPPEKSTLSPPRAKLSSARDFETGVFSSPAFMKRARVSYGSLLDDDFDIFDPKAQPKRSKKRQRTSLFGKGDMVWTYSSRSASPEPSPETRKTSDAGSSADDEDLTGHENLHTPSRLPYSSSPARPAMVDEGCQTKELSTTPPKSAQAVGEPRTRLDSSASPSAYRTGSDGMANHSSSAVDYEHGHAHDMPWGAAQNFSATQGGENEVAQSYIGFGIPFGNTLSPDSFAAHTAVDAAHHTSAYMGGSIIPGFHMTTFSSTHQVVDTSPIVQNPQEFSSIVSAQNQSFLQPPLHAGTHWHDHSTSGAASGLSAPIRDKPEREGAVMGRLDDEGEHYNDGRAAGEDYDSRSYDRTREDGDEEDEEGGGDDDDDDGDSVESQPARMEIQQHDDEEFSGGDDADGVSEVGQDEEFSNTHEPISEADGGYAESLSDEDDGDSNSDDGDDDEEASGDGEIDEDEGEIEPHPSKTNASHLRPVGTPNEPVWISLLSDSEDDGESDEGKSGFEDRTVAQKKGSDGIQTSILLPHLKREDDDEVGGIGALPVTSGIAHIQTLAGPRRQLDEDGDAEGSGRSGKNNFHERQDDDVSDTTKMQRHDSSGTIPKSWAENDSQSETEERRGSLVGASEVQEEGRVEGALLRTAESLPASGTRKSLSEKAGREPISDGGNATQSATTAVEADEGHGEQSRRKTRSRKGTPAPAAEAQAGEQKAAASDSVDSRKARPKQQDAQKAAKTRKGDEDDGEADQTSVPIEAKEKNEKRQSQTAADPESEEVLITVKSLRSRKVWKGKSIGTKGDLQEDPSVLLAKAVVAESAKKAEEEEVAPTTPRVTRSQAEKSEPSTPHGREVTAAAGDRRKDDSPPTIRVTRSMTEQAEANTRAAGTSPSSTRSSRRQATPGAGREVGRRAGDAGREATPWRDSEPGVKKTPSVAGSVAEEEDVSALKRELQKLLRSQLPDYLALRTLRTSLNKTVDVLAVCTSTPEQAHRPKHGPRDYMLELIVTDPSMSPSGVCVAHIFRPHQAALPVAQGGDVILLRHVQVVSIKDRGFGVRAGDASAWAVFEQGDEQALPQIKGPPVEVGEEEVEYAEGLKRWWKLQGENALDKIQRATQKALQAGGKGEGKS